MQLKNAENCCGCGACVQACPRQCITLTENHEGFWYPNIERDLCVNCGVCDKVCPMMTKVNTVPMTEVTAYAAYADNLEIRMDSSSGGIFSLLASWVLKQKGVIFGAAFDEAFGVFHIKIDDFSELPKLRGSKYLQSRIESTYLEAKNALDVGKLVLFSGTPCQISGLRCFLGKEYEGLFCVAVICHGVPSPKIWMHYLKEQKEKYGEEIQKISFRNKSSGWKNFHMRQQFADQSEYIKSLKDDCFMTLFLRNICLRPSCYACRFKGPITDVDITLGDAWGIETWMSDMDDDLGTSIVLLHSERGKQLWKMILPEVRAQKANGEVAVAYNSAFGKSVSVCGRRKLFFAAANRGAKMETLVKFTRRTLGQRVISLVKRCIGKLMHLLRITV